MFDALVKDGCTDLSSSLNPVRFTASAVVSGEFCEVWKAWMNSGILVAVKCLQPKILFDGDPKVMKVCLRIRSDLLESLAKSP